MFLLFNIDLIFAMVFEISYHFKGTGFLFFFWGGTSKIALFFSLFSNIETTTEENKSLYLLAVTCFIKFNSVFKFPTL